MSIEWYPLKFTPVFKAKPWGGRRLEELFGKPLPEGKIGESWEVSAHPEGPGLVAEGALSGKSLAELAAQWPVELMGARIAGRSARFPVLIKLLDAADVLSVQVHPDDGYAAEHTDDLGKEECWFVIHVGPRGRIYKGLKRRMDAEEFLALVREKRVAEEFNAFTPEVGDMVYLPARTLHTVEDIVFAEVQQSSDLTYRVYDWDRMGLDGKPRPLHLEASMAVARLAPPEENAVTPVRIDGECSVLVDSDKFKVSRVTTGGSREITVGPEAFRVLIFVAGSGRIGRVGYRAGDAILLPASLASVSVEPESDSDYLVVEPR